MKKVFAVLIGISCVLTINNCYTDDLPEVFSPDIVQINENEQCIPEPGKLKCRWEGDCKRLGNYCYNCLKGMKLIATPDGLMCRKSN